MSDVSDHDKGGKASFDHVYNEADPRDYFRTLGDLDYRAPADGARVFPRLVERQREQLGREDLVVLDLACSYGVNAALLNHDLTLDDLYARYRSPEVASLSTEELVLADREFYDEHRRPDTVRVLGQDVADRAVAYAQRVGLHWQSSSENLEEVDPSDALAEALAQVNLIIVTGGVGYISERTFDRVLKCVGGDDGCWVAAFVLRWIEYDRIAELLATYGLETEKLAGHVFRQRRFADDAERDFALKELRRIGVDPGGVFEGWYLSEFYLSRPKGQNHPPADELLSGVLPDAER